MRRILFLGDLHVGSSCALWPRDYKTATGSVISLNDPQRRLLAFFQAVCDHADVQKADTVFLMGDLCQGNNRKHYGRELMTADLDEQVRAAVSLLEPVCRGKKIFGVIGTPYHDSLDTHLDARVIEALGGRCLGKLAHVKVEETGHSFLVTHGTRGGSYYSGTFADKTTTSLLIGMGRGRLPRADLWIQGHLHHFWYHRTEAIGFLLVPCWQEWYYLDAVVPDYGKKQPDIGAVIVEFSKGDLYPLVKPLLWRKTPEDACLITL